MQDGAIGYSVRGIGSPPRRYRKDSPVLETEWTTAARVIDLIDPTSALSQFPPSRRRVEDRKGPLVSVEPNRLVTPLLSSAMVLVSTAITYPHPWHARRPRAGQSGQLGSPGPNFLPYSSQS
jgi:hypothetical protein